MNVAVFGAGAVGSYFGGMLARAGTPVTLIGREHHVAAIRAGGLLIESAAFADRVRVEASTDPAAVAGAEVVLVCVKTLDTEAAARAIAPHLSDGALVLSLQNGVDNAERIRAAAGIDAIPAVVYVGVAIPEPGRVRHLGAGHLILPGNRRRDAVDRAAAAFVHAGVPCRIVNDIAGELWLKLVLNCAYNAISAVTQAPYGTIVDAPPAREAMIRVTNEAVAVAAAGGVRLPVDDPVEAVLKLASAMPLQTSSTAQDVARGRPTEIDALNGYVAARGKELGVEAPVNQALYALVKLLEATPRRP